jgi:hypothetical protein
MRRTWTFGVVGAAALLLASLPCPAQERVLPPVEPVPPPREKPEPVPPPREEAPGPAAPEVEEHCPAGVRILWAEKRVPIQSLVPREVITLVEQPTLEIAYRNEKRVVANVVLVPREVERQVTCTTTKEVKVTDPVTGECSTVTQPCTEVRTIKETVYRAERQEREEVVLVPYLRPVKELVPRKDLLLEYRTEIRKDYCPVSIPADVPHPRVFQVPEPPPLPCEHDH